MIEDIRYGRYFFRW